MYAHKNYKRRISKSSLQKQLHFRISNLKKNWKQSVYEFGNVGRAIKMAANFHRRRILQKQKHGWAKKQKGARRRADRKKRQSRKRRIKNPVSRRYRCLKKTTWEFWYPLSFNSQQGDYLHPFGGFCEKKNSPVIIRGTTGDPIIVSLNKLMGDEIDVTALC